MDLPKEISPNAAVSVPLRACLRRRVASIRPARRLARAVSAVELEYFRRLFRSNGGYRAVIRAVIGLLAFLPLCYILIRAIRRGHGDLIFFMVEFCGLLFMVFKHAFVRDDVYHYLLFMSVLPLIFLLLYRFGGSKLDAIGRHSLSAVGLLMVLLIVRHSVIYHHWDIFDSPVKNQATQIGASFRIMTRPDYRAAVEAQAIDSIRCAFPLPGAAVRDLSGKPLDVFPLDIAIPYAYGFDWRPRPTLQSYAAHTAELDSVNAAHLAGPFRPQRVLYACKSFDDRYPVFDDPQTFAAILNNYHVLYSIDTAFVALAPDSLPVAMPWQPVTERTAQWGAPVSVPESPHGVSLCKGVYTVQLFRQAIFVYF